MRVLAMTLVGVVLISWAAASGQLDDPATAKRKYETYKVRVTGGDLRVDWRDFRLAAAVGGVDDGFDWHPVRGRVLQELNDGKNDQALSGAKEIIDHNDANPEGHLLAMMAYGKLGKDEDAKRERAIVDAIVQSILGSGDGKSAKTAWFTVDTSEEYFIISVVLGARPKSQALVSLDGHAYDKMTVVDEKGVEHELWFNTDTDMEIMAAALNPKNKKK